jgi:hypothetical protein
VTSNLAQARRLKTGKWRIYETAPELHATRDPAGGAIPSFESLEKARLWWAQLHPDDLPLDEAAKCARCGGYFGRMAAARTHQDKLYHEAHLPDRWVREIVV